VHLAAVNLTFNVAFPAALDIDWRCQRGVGSGSVATHAPRWSIARVGHGCEVPARPGEWMFMPARPGEWMFQVRLRRSPDRLEVGSDASELPWCRRPIRRHPIACAAPRCAVSECRLAVQNKINGLHLPSSTGAIRPPPKTSIKPVYWNGTHLSVFKFRVEKERDHDFNAAGASV
jgi:hypothetical protein